MDGAFQEMAQLCQAHNWNLVLITPPYTRDYTNCFDAYNENFFSVFYQYVQNLSRQYDIPYLDYSHDSRFVDDYSLFRNIDHLNQKGQTRFTSIVVDDLSNLF